MEIKPCQGKDIFERMNFLYQASHLIATTNRVAASYYGNTMMNCAKKAVLRIEPDIKRTICKRCQALLIPGETARVRLSSKPVKGAKWTCLTCMNTKKYPTRKGYKLWIDQPKAVLEILHYVPKEKSNDHEKTSRDTLKVEMNEVIETKHEKQKSTSMMKDHVSE